MSSHNKSKMTKGEILKEFLASNVLKNWHWFNYHFSFYRTGWEHPLAKAIIDSIYIIGQKVPGADKDFIKKLSSISGSELNLDHYEQIMQVLSEILVITQVVTFEWNENVEFEYEPKIGDSKKNPEINIKLGSKIIGLEVKSPNLVEHRKNRSKNPFQLVSRNPSIEYLPKGSITFPRDNPIKDFLISADKKFTSFKKHYPSYIGILHIVWDDYINEPISALINEPKGLFKSESFAKNSKKETLKFENVDFVVLSRHRYQLHQMAAGHVFTYPIEHPLDYGKRDHFPFKVLIQNPYSNVELSKDIIDCFQVYAPSRKLGAEYSPTDIVTWW